MRLLYVCHAPPCPPALGPARRHYHVLREAIGRHDVTLVTFGGPEDERRFHEHFNGSCENAVFIDMRRGLATKAAHRSWLLLTAQSDHRRLYSARFQRAIGAAAARRRYDVVLLSTHMLARYDLPARTPVIGDAHNVEHEVWVRAAQAASDVSRRWYYRVQAALTRREEQECAARVHFIAAASARDRDHFSRWLRRERVFVVPNGVDVGAFARPRTLAPPGPTLLFTGLLSYYPNAHAARVLVEQIFPRVVERFPAARLVIAGADPPRWLTRVADARITVTGRVDDMRPLFWQAGAYVMPLAIGSGTRVKALEAMAAGVPIVSTSLGCEGLDVTDGTELLLRDDPVAFADAAVQLLDDQACADRLRRAALPLVRNRYDLPVVGRSMDAALAHAAASGAA